MLKNLKYSLEDMLGSEYLNSVVEANAFLGRGDQSTLAALAANRVEFYPEADQQADDELLLKVGTKVISSHETDNVGAPTDSYKKAFHRQAAPLSGRGPFRLGEDGRLYFVGKSEHYHSSLGHNFKGFKLINHARELGILNATHNNTRGYITRTLERELIRTANGLAKGDVDGLERVLASTDKHVLNRVINLETGSLAVEAGIKMMLNRFYKLAAGDEDRAFCGRTPVFFVMADKAGGREANYHGTTVFAQTFRDMWPEIYKTAEDNGLYKVVSVKINDIEDFKAKIEQYNKPPYKTAGFLHEIVLMNYAGVRLHKEYLHAAYELCRKYDTPTLADEIQSCVWYEELYLFKKYELTPDFVIIGKGFSGGEYPASKVLTTAEMDSLSQFGALVTNGQEELASLSYLITMRFVQENGKEIEENEKLFFDSLQDLAARHTNVVKSAEGLGFLAALVFHDLETAARFAKLANAACIDVSAQTYKKNCPAAVLIKLPLITSPAAIRYLAATFDRLLAQL